MRRNKFQKCLATVLVLAILSMPLPPAPPVSADGNEVLGHSLSYSLRGGVTAAGVGLRGVGEGEIPLVGIPFGATVFQAFLYWGTIGTSAEFTSPTLNEENVSGELIGVSADTCWGAANNFIYRAEVTHLVPGNGLYTLAGFPADLEEEGNDTQGASLVVIYAGAGEPYRTVVINDGAVTLDLVNNTYTDVITGFIPDASPASEANIIYLVGDGQSRWDTGNVTFNGTSIAHNIFNGEDGPMWGTHTFQVSELVTEAPVTTRINNEDPDNPDGPDCIVWGATIFSVTAAPPQEVQEQLTQSFNITTRGDAIAAGTGLRGVGSGVIELAGIPDGASIVQAFLYWATLGSHGHFTGPSLNGQAVAGRLIGVSADTCWGVSNNFVYRADVTELVGGNGAYSISGLPDSLASGNDSQGASLVVIYAGDITIPLKTIIINDGSVTLDLVRNRYTDTITGFTTDETLTAAHVTYLIGDGQDQWDTGNVTFNGISIAQNVFTGIDGSMWGTHTFDITALSPSDPARTTIDNNVNGVDSPDCLLWAATIFSVTPPQPVFVLSHYFPFVANQR